MTLAVHELAHGRVLSTYERYGVKFLRSMHRAQPSVTKSIPNRRLAATPRYCRNIQYHGVLSMLIFVR